MRKMTTNHLGLIDPTATDIAENHPEMIETKQNLQTVIILIALHTIHQDLPNLRNLKNREDRPIHHNYR